MLGQTLGSYTLEAELGRGGMGAVYTAVHSLLGRRAAVKVLLPELSRNQDIVQRFFNEARAATAIKHPSIVEIYDFGWAADGCAYIVMELMEGESLATRLQRGPLSAAATITIARQVANALAAAHRASIVHRDLKPDNVFLVHDVEVAGGERVKLLDFGIAKLAAEGIASRTSTGAIMGTPIYMSPEQCEGARLVDHRSDLYSLGCMMFEMMAGRPPFVNSGVGGLIGMHLHVPAPLLRSVAPDAPAEVETIIARLLAKAPAERFQSADELATALGRTSANVAAMPSMPSVPPSSQASVASRPAGAPMGSSMGASGPGAPTTLSSAAGASHSLPPAASSSKRGLWLALGGVVVVAGIAVAIVAGSGGSKDPVVAAVGGADAAVLAEAIDAASAAVAVVDAGVSLDPLLAPAQQALADRRWASARALAEDVLRKDPKNGDAVAIRDQAQRGVDAETNLDEMEKALARKDWRVVRDELDAVYDTTVDGDPYRAEADAMIADARPRVIAEAKASIERSNKKGDCAASKKKAKETVERWGDEAKVLEPLAAGCKPATATVGGGDVVTPPPPPEGDAKALLAKVNDAARSGQYARALKLCEQGLESNPDRVTLVQLHTGCAIAACNLKNKRKAKEYFEKLTGQRQGMVKQVCLRNQIGFGGDEEPPPPAGY